MPVVNGKHYPYTAKGQAAAKKKLSGAAHRSKMVKRATEGLKKVFT